MARDDEDADDLIGHNSEMNQATVGQMRAIVERVERLEEEKKSIGEDIKEVYSEAKANGFDVKALRHIVKLRKQDVDERKEFEEILDLYLSALGMIV